jgi:hypothetical protein
MKYKANIYFNKQCLNQKIIPNYAKLGIPYTSPAFLILLFFFFFFFLYGATARGGPWPPFQYASKPLDPLLCPSIRLFTSSSGP